MVDCDRVRFGGTIAGSTISGGTVVTSPSIFVNEVELLGHPGFRGFDTPLLSSDGEFFRTQKPLNPRFMTLTILTFDRDINGLVTDPDGNCQELENSTDTLLGLLGLGQFMIERELPNGDVRWIMAQVNGAASFIQGPIHTSRQLICPIRCAYPMWQSETQTSGAITTSVVNAGNGRISNAVITLGGSAVLTNPSSGERLENLDGGSIVVDVGTRTVTQGGSPADNLLEPSTPSWMTFGGGTTTITTTGSVSAVRRDHWI